MPGLPLPATDYSAADHPWIDVRTGPHYTQVGLRTLFLDAHTIDDLALPHPPAASMLLRIAVAITARITALDDPDLTAAQWTRRRREALNRKAFDPETVHAYFDRHHFGVFHPTRPWLQDPTLPDQCPRTIGINDLVHGRPAGRNLAWFGPHHNENATPLTTAQALQHLLAHHGYGRPGAGALRTTTRTRSHYLSSGPLRGTVSFHPLGRNLHETLLAGLPKFIGDEQLPDDTCPWEDGHAPTGPDSPLDPVTWPGRLLTGRSRHAILLIPGDDTNIVTDAYLTWATQQPKLEATDPYLAYTIDTSKKIDKRRIVHRADASRAWWRELDTLLLAPDEERAQRRPEIFDTLNDLPADLRRALRIRVHGFDQDTAQALDRQWYTALTPPLLAWTQEHDPAKAQRIADCCQAAEATALRLAEAANQAWADTTTPPDASSAKRDKPRASVWASKAVALYWPLAETAFFELLETDTPTAPVFAQRAVKALRDVTRTTRAKNPRAARAVTAATGKLRTAAAPTTKSSR
ncbi:type I-E CRISPR-associated protein Cse1/CasA [Streptomyces hydrogenans]|uniref:type I-E CRISPR-associated protein Cse1/CasA n=1 Tax=Streptomyces hydrogenans TaxID=1873719 RepID=UPI00369C7DA3